MHANERDQVAEQFGVAPEQVQRDHLISHLLGFLSNRFGDRIHFIGGTALARTHLTNGRLSEDIDLIAVDSRRAVATELDDELPRAVDRTHGRLTLAPAFSSVADTFSISRLRVSNGRLSWPDKPGSRSLQRKPSRLCVRHGLVLLPKGMTKPPSYLL